MTKRILNIAPSYPLNEIEFWRIQVAESESGKEVRSTRWNFPRHDWDLYWRRAARVSEAEAIVDILRETKGGGESFHWVMPYPSTRKDIYMGTGTGSRENWILPVWVPGSYSIYVNSAIYTAGSQYTVDSYGGANSFHIIQINSPPPAAGEAVHCTFVNGYYAPLVRQLNPWKSALIPPGFSTFECYLTLREPKEDMPAL